MAKDNGKYDLVRLPSIKEVLQLRKTISTTFKIDGNTDGEGNLIRGMRDYKIKSLTLVDKLSFEKILDVSGEENPTGIRKTNFYFLEEVLPYFKKSLGEGRILLLDPTSINVTPSMAHGPLNSYDMVCSGSFYIAQKPKGLTFP